MPPEAALRAAEQLWREPDAFARRTQPADLPEWMDDPCSPDDLRACLRDLAWVNRLTLGSRPTLAFLRAVRARGGWTRPLHIVDVGAGGGDGLRLIARWARRRKLPVRLTGIDLNPQCTQVARERTDLRRPEYAAIEWLTGDAFAFAPPGGIDLVVSSLVTHHMGDGEVARFLRWSEETARVGWFVNDLRRSASACRWFSALARTLRWHPFVRHDGPVSFRRAFQPEDWQQLLRAAGVPEAAAEVRAWQPGRLCVGRLR